MKPSLRAFAVGAGGFGLLVWVGCAFDFGSKSVRSETHAGRGSQGLAIGRLAVAPFESVGNLAPPQNWEPTVDAAKGKAPGYVNPADATALSARFITEAIAARGVDVIPSHDVMLAAGDISQPIQIRPLAALVQEKFGADSLLVGRVSRFRERVGQDMGASKPASVSFTVTIYRCATGVKLWTANFDETQVPMNENVLRARHYPGGGTRWLTVEELGRWGAKNVAASLPLGP